MFKFRDLISSPKLHSAPLKDKTVINMTFTESFINICLVLLMISCRQTNKQMHTDENITTKHPWWKVSPVMLSKCVFLIHVVLLNGSN